MQLAAQKKSDEAAALQKQLAELAQSKGWSAEELLRAADKALYLAKCLGDNQIACAPVEIDFSQPAKAT